MDTLEELSELAKRSVSLEIKQKAIKEVLNSYTTGGYGEGVDLKNVVVFDDQHSRYLVMVQGTEDNKRVNEVFCEVDIIGDKIVILENTSDEEITEDLVKKGIDRAEITNINLLKHA